ncbi:hypothetical protein, partial [Streptomyces sp. bgisy060]|uniref:hypothetical protein n=1 Tax=Streptomyces sp. bgisy060 TaxID=3413775 RepID=UPI003EB7C903
MFKHPAVAIHYSRQRPSGAYFGMPEFAFEWLDCDSPKKSANVVDTPRGKGSQQAARNEFRTGSGTENESGKVG